LAAIAGPETMLQATAARAAAVAGSGPPFVVCGAAHVDEVERQLADRGVDAAKIVIEPVGRNTAPAIAAVALSVQPDDLLLILPADHVIADVDAFVEAVSHGVTAAEEGMLVTFGVRPTSPATGYGYIEHGPDVTDRGVAMSVVRFVEKPDIETAQQYLASGTFSWNAGLFLFRAGAYLTELAKHRPDILDSVRAALDHAEHAGARTTLDPERFEQCPAESIDYAVMEKTDRAAVVPLEAGWSDVGSWAAWWELADKDATGNAVSGAAYLEGVTNSLVRAGERPVAVIGLDGVVVVDTGDAILISSRDRSEDVKRIVESLTSDEREEI
jgi:mannose-1-phosphate guanylyltransferase/mannose-6-phosphate isomerase